jgi:DNA-binding winged helix-turn-helix (wHTH) protein
MRVFYLGAWRVEPTARELSCQGEQRRVSPKAMQVLGLLAKNPGVVISRSEFMEKVWPDVIVGEEVLTQAIAELRRQLDDDPRAPTYIETVHKSGYRLITEISSTG